MRVLLDTHALLWWLEGSSKLSRRGRKTIQMQETAAVVSSASAWEIAIKAGSGKLDAGPLLSDFRRELEEEGFTELPILFEHAVRAGLLPGPLRDPFDRMLIAQAQAEGIAVISKDAWFDDYAVQRIW